MDLFQYMPSMAKPRPTINWRSVRHLWIEAVPGWMSKVVEVSALVAPPVEGPGAVDGGGGVQGVVHSGQGVIPHQQPRGSLLFKQNRLLKGYCHKIFDFRFVHVWFPTSH